MSQKPDETDYTLIREASLLTAEMVAAIRARTEDTPEAKALVTFSGTVISSVFHTLAPPPVVNISPVRDLTMNHLVDKYLPHDGQQRVFVDLACGFSSRGAVLARLRPDVLVYEIDLPPVIDQKMLRYSRRKIELPPNHHMIRADVKLSALTPDLLGGHYADVIMARGLLIYFDVPAIQLAAHNILSGLKPGGHFIADLVMGTEETLGPFNAIVGFIRKQTTSDATRGRVPSPEAGESLFQSAGYAAAKAYRFSDFEEWLELPKPYNNMMLVIHAQRSVADKPPDKPAKAAAVPPEARVQPSQETEAVSASIDGNVAQKAGEGESGVVSQNKSAVRDESAPDVKDDTPKPADGSGAE
jgi:O-methyltransferase involved in polyketide biosynthesis